MVQEGDLNERRFNSLDEAHQWYTNPMNEIWDDDAELYVDELLRLALKENLPGLSSKYWLDVTEGLFANEIDISKGHVQRLILLIDREENPDLVEGVINDLRVKFNIGDSPNL